MPRKNETNKSKSQHPILDGIAYIYKRESSGDVWQFRMYVSNEHRDYRVSLRTRDFESAVEKKIQSLVNEYGNYAPFIRLHELATYNTVPFIALNDY